MYSNRELYFNIFSGINFLVEKLGFESEYYSTDVNEIFNPVTYLQTSENITEILTIYFD